MFSKKLSGFIVCTLFFTQPQIQALAWSDALTGACWLALAAPLIGSLRLTFVESARVQACPDASTEIGDYVKAVLVKHGCAEELVRNIQVKLDADFVAHYSLREKHVITVPKEFAEKYQGKPVIEAVMRHEAAHLEHHDKLRMLAFLAVSPILVHFLFNGVTYPISCLLKPYTPMVLQILSQIASVFMKMSLIGVGRIFFSKYKEYCADKKAAESIKDPEVLKAMEKICMAGYEAFERKEGLTPEQRGTWLRFILDEIAAEEIMHPSHFLRAQAFADAAKKLAQDPKEVIA